MFMKKIVWFAEFRMSIKRPLYRSVVWKRYPDDGSFFVFSTYTIPGDFPPFQSDSSIVTNFSTDRATGSYDVRETSEIGQEISIALLSLQTVKKFPWLYVCSWFGQILVFYSYDEVRGLSRLFLQLMEVQVSFVGSSFKA